MTRYSTCNALPIDRGNTAHGDRKPINWIDECEVKGALANASKIVERCQNRKSAGAVNLFKVQFM
jgi:hypothetical protein